MMDRETIDSDMGFNMAAMSRAVRGRISVLSITQLLLLEKIVGKGK
jgi:hypothetical protein